MAKVLRFREEKKPVPKTAVTNVRVGEKLLQAGRISQDQLQIALHEQRRTGRMLGAILVQFGFLDEETLACVLAERTGFLHLDLKKILIDADLLRGLPREVATRCRILPVALNDGMLEVAMADPYDVMAMDEIRRYFPPGVEVVPRVASPSDIADIIAHYYDGGASLDAVLRELETGNFAAASRAGEWEHPVIRLANMILADGVRRGASDIHLEPEGSFVRLRYRIDGIMQQARALHLAHWPELSNRIKIMAELNVADTRSLQDGRFEMQVGGAAIDFRVAVMPTSQGENIVIRILDHRRALLPLAKLGFNDRALAQIDRILSRPEGIILVTGPTGSGKTTTLYSMLTKLNAADVNIMTLEEPIEYQFGLIRQTSVREGQGLSFAEGVRGILRQDPDIIFIGEIRDPETAQMALRASMTGHQVFSTLHCNDALGALPRLVDLGLKPRMLAGHVAGVIAQRLVRKLCPQCRRMRPATREESMLLRCTPVSTEKALAGFAEAQQAPYGETMVGEPVGCEYCDDTGYRGRIAAAEILAVTPAMDALIAEDAPRAKLRKQLQKENFQTLAEDGIAKVIAGEIALDSLRRAVDLTRAN